jgi:large subunit ribosomal protein L10
MPLKADPTTPQIAKKAAVIAEIKAKLDGADAALLTEYRGLTVDQIAELRAALRPTTTEYKVYKNSLVRRAADEAGIGEQVNEMLAGPVAIAFVQGDAAAAAKALRDFAKTVPELVLKGGLLGTRGLSSADVEALADLPPRDALLSQIAGLFEAPLAQTLGVLEALLRDTVGLVQALADKVAASEAPAATAPEPQPEAAPEPEATAEVAAEAAADATPEPEAATEVAPAPEAATDSE